VWGHFFVVSFVTLLCMLFSFFIVVYCEFLKQVLFPCFPWLFFYILCNRNATFNGGFFTSPTPQQTFVIPPPHQYHPPPSPNTFPPPPHILLSFFFLAMYYVSLCLISGFCTSFFFIFTLSFRKFFLFVF